MKKKDRLQTPQNYRNETLPLDIVLLHNQEKNKWNKQEKSLYLLYK